MALGAWFVPLGTVLDAHGYHGIKSLAFAASAAASCVSPLVFASLADRHVAPERVLAGLALSTAAAMAMASTAIERGAGPGWVLVFIQLHALCSAPAWPIANALVLGRLGDSTKQFGPIRAVATLGWMAGCWVVSAMGADNSTRSGWIGAGVWLCVAVFSVRLRASYPSGLSPARSLQERLGLDAIRLMRDSNHRVVFIAGALFAIPLAAFYPYAPTHLRELGMVRSAAWMTLGQVTEVIAMVLLPWGLGRWSFKRVLGAGLTFGVLRYALCAQGSPAWVLSGVFLHGFAFSLFFITAQIYLDRRVEAAWRNRGQALFSLMMSGVGNLTGYLTVGLWFEASGGAGRTNWPLFWGGLSCAAAFVLAYFLGSYKGIGGPMALAGGASPGGVAGQGVPR